jgi:hypothetical protein
MRHVRVLPLVLALALSLGGLPAQAGQRSRAPVVKTTIGQIRVLKVVRTDRWPPGCENPPSVGCDGVADGYMGRLRR